MSDDLRERQPLRDRADNPPESGLRSDNAGSGSAASGAAPGGAQAEPATRSTETGSNQAPPDPLADVDHPSADE